MQNAIAQATQQADAILNGYLSQAISINNTATGFANALKTRIANLNTNLASFKTPLSWNNAHITTYQWIQSVSSLIQKGGVIVNLGIPSSISCMHNNTC